MSNEMDIRLQVQKVIKLVIEKKDKNDHEFLDTLLMRLQKLLTALNKGSDLENIGTNFGIKGALRAYFDTSIVESYEEPLVKELDKLETMINKYN